MILKETDSFKYELLAFEENEFKDYLKEWFANEGSVLFSGSREQLLNMPEEFWKEVVKSDGILRWNYKTKRWKRANTTFYRDSGRSAIEIAPGNYYLIIKTVK